MLENAAEIRTSIRFCYVCCPNDSNIKHQFPNQSEVTQTSDNAYTIHYFKSVVNLCWYVNPFYWAKRKLSESFLIKTKKNFYQYTIFNITIVVTIFTNLSYYHLNQLITKPKVPPPDWKITAPGVAQSRNSLLKNGIFYNVLAYSYNSSFLGVCSSKKQVIVIRQFYSYCQAD